MTFINANRRFASVAELEAYLHTQPPPAWGVIGSTYHNTYHPDEDEWAGHASMLSMQHTYATKNPPWDRGPHLYLAAGTRFNGIWMMTPPTMPAVHGVTCNKNHFGLEVVGNFQSHPMSPDQQELLLGTVVVLHRWARIGPELNAHRDCVARTCPGDAAYAQKPLLRAELARRLVIHVNPTYRIRAGVLYANIRQGPGTNFPVALNGQAKLWPGDRFEGDKIISGEVINGDGRWVHLADGRGFVSATLVEGL